MTNHATGPGEIELWRGHASHWHYFWMWFFAILLFVVVIGLLMIIWIFIDRKRRTYIITNHKIVYETGLIAKSSNEIRIKDIRAINLSKHGLFGFIGVGDLEFSSSASDKAEIVFGAVPRASEVRDLVRKYQEA